MLSCSAKPQQATRSVEYYYPKTRTIAPEPVYSRLTWSHLPKPLPRNVKNSPYIQPVIVFDFNDSTLKEAITALAQTIGYRWEISPDIEDKNVSIRMEGTIDEVLAEIANQAQVHASFDRKNRIVNVLDVSMAPSLISK